MSVSQGLTATSALNNIGFIQTNSVPTNGVSASGIFSLNGALPNGTSSITIPGMTSTGVTLLSYIHDSTGGGTQYFVKAIAGTNQCLFSVNQVTAAGDSINWLTNKLQ